MILRRALGSAVTLVAEDLLMIATIAIVSSDACETPVIPRKALLSFFHYTFDEH